MPCSYNCTEGPPDPSEVEELRDISGIGVCHPSNFPARPQAADDD
jgi:hypothetical protein